MIPNWIKNGAKIQHKYSSTKKTISEVKNGDDKYHENPYVLYESPYGWDTVRSVADSYFPIDPEPIQSLPKWFKKGAVIKQKGSDKLYKIKSWTDHEIFYDGDGNSIKLEINIRDWKPMNYFPIEPKLYTKTSCLTCLENFNDCS